MNEVRGIRKDDWVRLKTPEPGEGECVYRIEGFRILGGRLEIKPAMSDRGWVPASEVLVHLGGATEPVDAGEVSGEAPSRTTDLGNSAGGLPQLIIDAAAVRRASIGLYDVMLYVTMCTNHDDRPVLRQVFMTPEVARKLAADIHDQFGK